jgi:hypothetical protein
MTLHGYHRLEMFEETRHEQYKLRFPVCFDTFTGVFVVTFFEITFDVFVTIVYNHSVVCFVTDYVVTYVFYHMIVIYSFSVLLSHIEIMEFFICEQIIHNVFIRLIEYIFKIDNSQSVLVQIYVIHTLE